MDKKFILLILLLVVAGIALFLGYKSKSLKRAYEADVKRELGHAASSVNDVLTEEDIGHLPEAVKKYLRYANVIGKEKVRNFRLTFEGEFRPDPKKGWAKLSYGSQYSDLTDTTRLYFMQLKMFGLQVSGLHKYADAKATMLVKILGLITVADGKGPKMDEGETVTVFNDMCLLAPASLIDKRIEWETFDPLTVKATFNNNGIKVSALLYFNEKGELINFVSDDRYFSPKGKTYQKFRWSTPVEDYKDCNGVRIATYGEAIWSFPEGEYCYGRINIKDIRYNVER